MTITTETIVLFAEVLGALSVICGTIMYLLNKYYKGPQVDIKNAICKIEKSIDEINQSIQQNQKDINELKQEIKDLKQTNRTFYYIINTFIDIVYKSNQSQELQDIKETLTKNLIEKATT